MRRQVVFTTGEFIAQPLEHVRVLRDATSSMLMKLLQAACEAGQHGLNLKEVRHWEDVTTGNRHFELVCEAPVEDVKADLARLASMFEDLKVPEELNDQFQDLLRCARIVSGDV